MRIIPQIPINEGNLISIPPRTSKASSAAEMQRADMQQIEDYLKNYRVFFFSGEGTVCLNSLITTKDNSSASMSMKHVGVGFGVQGCLLLYRKPYTFCSQKFVRGFLHEGMLMNLCLFVIVFREGTSPSSILSS